jgi:hypothetical protein
MGDFIKGSSVNCVNKLLNTAKDKVFAEQGMICVNTFEGGIDAMIQKKTCSRLYLSPPTKTGQEKVAARIVSGRKREMCKFAG